LVVLLLLWIWVLPGRAGAEVFTPAQENQLLALRMFTDVQRDREWEWGDWEALLELWERESNWRADAANPRSSAFGIPQGLTRTHGLEGTDYMVDPRAQIEWGLEYISGRYGSPSAALEHHDSKGWY
jgi:hypothetical protein